MCVHRTRLVWLSSYSVDLSRIRASFGSISIRRRKRRHSFYSGIMLYVSSSSVGWVCAPRNHKLTRWCWRFRGKRLIIYAIRKDLWINIIIFVLSGLGSLIHSYCFVIISWTLQAQMFIIFFPFIPSALFCVYFFSFSSSVFVRPWSMDRIF